MEKDGRLEHLRSHASNDSSDASPASEHGVGKETLSEHLHERRSEAAVQMLPMWGRIPFGGGAIPEMMGYGVRDGMVGASANVYVIDVPAWSR
jgi:hypothetical protein